MFEPWCHETLERARQEEKPIFLSIAPKGIDVVLDDEIQKECVCIRVDPDEHAEVESVYGAFAEALTGEPITWPLNLILAPDQKPITVASGDFPEVEVTFDEEKWGNEIPEISLDPILDMVDPLYGGFENESKHPMGYVYSALIQAFPDDPRAWFFAKRSLESIAKGAIRDPITGGIAMSGNSQWNEPEGQMRLCDNALLAKAFLDVGMDELAASLCQFMIDYLQSPGGGFYASLSGMKKWARKDMDRLVAEFHCLPMEGDAFLRQEESIEEFAEKIEMEVGDFRRLLMLEYRKLRYDAIVNEQILPLWNGFAISALVHVGKALGVEAFEVAAKRAFETMKPRRFDEFAAQIHAGLALGHDMEPLAKDVAKRFKAEGGPFYMVDEASPIFVRRCDLYDGIVPCGNSLHAENLLNMGEMGGVEDILRCNWQGIYFLIACQKHRSLRG